MARAGLACSPRLAGWLPGSEAEPPGIEQVSGAPQEDATPSVLTKLQKWADYEAVGSPVWPTNFLPMKTPMSTEILDNWSLPEAPKHALTVPLLLQRQAALGREIGLIIDLANHDCLYSDDMPDHVEYEHVQLIAKVLPSREAINEVERIAKSFWEEHPSKFIGVHCAYGFNRTGFVVCSYLCQACGLSVEQALESFAAARPPGVKHEKFIRELYARYGSSNSSAGGAGSSTGGVGSGSGGLLVGQEGAAPPAAPAGGPAVEADGPHASQAGAPHAAAAAEWCAAQQQQRQRQPSQQGGALQAGAAAAAGAGDVQQQDEEPHHFEDAADLIRRERCHRRSVSLTRAGTAGSAEMGAIPAGPLPMPTPAGGAPRPGAASRSRTPSRPGSTASSRNPSRHGGSQCDLASAAAGDAVDAAGTAAATQGSSASGEAASAASAAADMAAAAAVDVFVASRRLMQRKPSRGGGSSGGLTLALAAGSGGLSRCSGGSPHSSSSGPAGSSPVSGGASAVGGMRTAQSSMSDFAAAAVHLEGASHLRRDGGSSNSMRRETSLGLAKALCEDFLQNNGTPSAVAPITAAAEAEWGEEDPEAAAEAAGVPAFRRRAGNMSPDQRAAAAAASQERFRASSDGNGDGGCFFGSACGSDGELCQGACDSPDPDAAAWPAGSPPPAYRAGSAGGGLGSSPTHGGIPLPPVPGNKAQPSSCSRAPLRGAGAAAGAGAPHHQHQHHQHHQQQPFAHQQPPPGTPITPAHIAGGGGGGASGPGCSLQKQPSVGGFPRSVSIDSENPSLGFGMREALAHLRFGAAGGGDAAPHRGPQALADLFREDSDADLADGQAGLDADEHVEALAMASGQESPCTAGLLQPLPQLAEVASSAEAGSSFAPSVGSLLLHQRYAQPQGDAGAAAAAAQDSSKGSTPRVSATTPQWALLPQQQHGGEAVAAAAVVPPSGRPTGSSAGKVPSRQRGGSKGRCRVM